MKFRGTKILKIIGYIVLLLFGIMNMFLVWFRANLDLRGGSGSEHDQRFIAQQSYCEEKISSFKQTLCITRAAQKEIMIYWIPQIPKEIINNYF